MKRWFVILAMVVLVPLVAHEASGNEAIASVPILGLATVVYHVTNLDEAKAWYAKAFSKEPYFDEPFYVGFDIGGFELGLTPETSEEKAGDEGPVAYWRVDDVEAALAHFQSLGAKILSPIQDVGEGIKVTTLSDPFGNPVGLIENPHFGK